MRSLLRDFADRGGTVLLSSHLLHEVETVADRLVVIGAGRIVAQGTKEELLAGRGMLVRGLDADELEQVLASAGLDASRTKDDAFLVDADAEAIGRAAAGAGTVLLELRPAEGARLEDLFLKLTASAPEQVAA
jgi:ABC-2 type transport system ATP-binding protein